MLTRESAVESVAELPLESGFVSYLAGSKKSKNAKKPREKTKNKQKINRTIAFPAANCKTSFGSGSESGFESRFVFFLASSKKSKNAKNLGKKTKKNKKKKKKQIEAQIPETLPKVPRTCKISQKMSNFEFGFESGFVFLLANLKKNQKCKKPR